MSTSSPSEITLISLDQLGRADAQLAGAKAANLGELLRAGFAVPAGVVLPPGVDGDAFASVQSILGDGPWAVRSSGVAEDLADASFAGQYVTLLGVHGRDQLEEAVRRCRASAASAQVLRYQSERAEDSAGGAMPVLVQRMIQAHAAGVAFTANPVTGARDEIIVSAVRGLGERLVSGESNPDEWVVKTDSIECRRAPERALDEVQVGLVASLARQIEIHFGGQPHDIEWAIEGETLWVLQARPITALPESIAPVSVPVDPPPGFWERDGSHFPRPVSPMQRSFFFAAMSEGLRHLFAEYGVPAETLAFTEIGGWEYQRLVPLGGKEPPPLPRWLTGAALALLVRVDPRLRDRAARAARAIGQDVFSALIDRWHAEQRSSFERRASELRSVRLDQLDDEHLLAHLDATIGFVEDGARAHVGLDGCAMYPFWRLWLTSRELVGWDEARTLDLVCGYSATSTEPARRLAELARLAGTRPSVLAALQDPKQAVGQLADLDPEFDAAFRQYLDEFGYRALRYDVADPIVAEVPELVLGLIRDQVQRGYDPLAEVAQQREVRQRARTEIDRALVDQPGRRAEFEDRLGRAERAYGLKEENVFRTINVPLAVVRLAVLELGRRLADRGQIAQRDDVFLLELEEARQALADGGERKALVRRRKGELLWVEAHPGPASYGRNPGPPPPMWGLPSATAELMQVLAWSFERTFDAARSARKHAEGATQLNGTAASSGVYTGPARVVMHEGEFSKIRAGDVLVCPITSPVWSVLFPSVGAVVTNTGGILAHSAIIAREYGIPAVVGAGNATDLIRDGQLVRVDGGRGAVEILA